MALRVQDRFKGRRTKYYVLKGFTSVTEVILSLLETAVTKRGDLGPSALKATSKHSSDLIDKLAAPPAALQRGLTRAFNPRMTASPARRTGKRVSTRGGFASMRGNSRRQISIAGESYEDVDTLQAMAQEWIDKLAQFASVYALAKPYLILFQAHLHFLTDRVASGLKLAQRSGDLAHKMEMPYEEALAKAFLAKHLPKEQPGNIIPGANVFGSKQERMEHESAEIFARLGVSTGDKQCSSSSTLNLRGSTQDRETVVKFSFREPSVASQVDTASFRLEAEPGLEA